MRINFFWLLQNQFQLELNSFVSNFELAQQTFLAGEIRLALLRSPCFSLPLLPCFLAFYNLQRRRKSFHFHLSLFLYFSIASHTPLLLTPPFCPSSLSYSFLLPFLLLAPFLSSCYLPLSFPILLEKEKWGIIYHQS